MTENPLAKERTRPASCKSQQVKERLGNAPGSTDGSDLVDAVCREGEEAGEEIQGCDVQVGHVVKILHHNQGSVPTFPDISSGEFSWEWKT